MRKLKWHTERRKVDDLIPYEKNPRQLTEKQTKDLQKSLEKFDLAEIPAINTDNRIVAGHQRLAIMQRLGRGQEEIDVRVPNRALTEEEFKEYNVRSNLNTGEWDFDILANEFEMDDLVDWGFDENWILQHNNIENINENEEWEGMPDFESYDGAYRMYISFSSESDRKKFNDEYNMKCEKKSDKVWATWWPYKEKEDYKSLKYE